MKTASVHSYTTAYRQGLCSMMVDYFKNDIKEEYSPQQMAVVVARIEYEMRLYPLYIKIAEYGGKPVGFCMFQKDTEENPWGIRPGWGFIREMYIQPKNRGGGLGGLLYNAMEQAYGEIPVKGLYLTAESEDAQGFWKACGFLPTGKIHPKNNLEIFQKFLDR